MVVPAPSIVPPVQTVGAADGQGARAGEVAARLVQGAGGGTAVEFDRAAVDGRGAREAVRYAPEVTRKSPLGTSTMPGPPMPAPVPSVKSPPNWSVQPAATVKLAGSVPVAVPSQARSSVPESTSIPPGLVRKGKLPPPVMVAVLDAGPHDQRALVIDRRRPVDIALPAHAGQDVQRVRRGIHEGAAVRLLERIQGFPGCRRRRLPGCARLRYSTSSVSPEAPSWRVPSATVVPVPLMVPPVQVICPLTVSGSEPVRTPDVSVKLAALDGEAAARGRACRSRASRPPCFRRGCRRGNRPVPGFDLGGAGDVVHAVGVEDRGTVIGSEFHGARTADTGGRVESPGRVAELEGGLGFRGEAARRGAAPLQVQRAGTDRDDAVVDQGDIIDLRSCPSRPSSRSCPGCRSFRCRRRPRWRPLECRWCGGSRSRPWRRPPGRRRPGRSG